MEIEPILCLEEFLFNDNVDFALQEDKESFGVLRDLVDFEMSLESASSEWNFDCFMPP
jgi:hypothetical protein